MNEDQNKVNNEVFSAEELDRDSGLDIDGVGKIQVAERVFEHIAYREASQVEGVVGLGPEGSFVDDLRGLVKKGGSMRGVDVRREGDGLEINLSITLRYGCNIRELAQELQRRIVEAVECMTGQRPNKVNINLLGLVDAQISKPPAPPVPVPEQVNPKDEDKS